MQTAEHRNFNHEDYLEWEVRQQEKYEYIKGEVFAMGGARREHVLVCGNFYASIKHQLKGKPCIAYIADMKLRVEHADAYFYPDVMVSCDKNDNDAEHFISKPSLIAEVLSDSTEAFDRGEKFAAYRTLPSLKEYVIVDIKTRRVECYRRTGQQEWLLHDYTDEQIIELQSLNLAMPLPEIFEDLPAPSGKAP